MCACSMGSSSGNPSSCPVWMLITLSSGETNKAQELRLEVPNATARLLRRARLGLGELLTHRRLLVVRKRNSALSPRRQATETA